MKYIELNEERERLSQRIRRMSDDERENTTEGREARERLKEIIEQMQEIEINIKLYRK